MIIRKKFDEHKRHVAVVSGVSRTQQCFRDECDIENILKRYKKTGILPVMIKQNPAYGDYSDVGTYQDALEVVIRAQEQFKGLPAHVRERFGNDASQFLQFATDEKNREEMGKMGLLKALPEKEVFEVNIPQLQLKEEDDVVVNTRNGEKVGSSGLRGNLTRVTRSVRGRTKQEG